MLELENGEPQRSVVSQLTARFNRSMLLRDSFGPPPPPLPPVTVKACRCASGSCPVHADVQPLQVPKLQLTRPGSSSETYLRKSRSQMATRVNRQRSAAVGGSKIPLASQSTTTTSIDGDATFEKWLKDKNEEKRRLESERQLIKAAMTMEKQRKTEIERKNFGNWLAAKKADDRRKKMDHDGNTIVDEVEKRNKKLENELNYRLWCKKKEEEYLEKQLKEQVDKVREEDDRRTRIARNEAAYEEWLKNARNKPKPLPLNRGLESLRSSVSVSYVNPTPWEPNIVDLKPTTQ